MICLRKVVVHKVMLDLESEPGDAMDSCLQKAHSGGINATVR